MSTRILATTIALGWFLHAGPAGRTQGAANLRIAGRVVSDSGQALAGAAVRMSRLDAGATTRLERTTDAQGQFAFDGLAAAWYDLSASKPGFAPAEFGATRPGGMGTPVVLDAQGTVEGLTLRLSPAAELAGAVRLPDGSPMGDVRVEALASAIDTRGRATYSSAGSARTDDRGAYRIGGLPAGTYVVKASPQNAPISPFLGPDAADRSRGATAAPPRPPVVQGYTPTFHPSAPTESDAAPVDLAAGESRDGVDVLVRLVPFARIEGRLDAAGPLGATAEVTLQSVDARGLAGPRAGAPHVQDRAFVIADVPPGRYVLHAQARLSDGTEVAAFVGVTIYDGQDAISVNPLLVPAGRVTGRATLDGDGGGGARAVRLALYDASDAETPRAPVAATLRGDGTVEFPAVEPGRYRAQMVSLPTERPTWALTSARVGGEETIDTSFEVPAGGDVHVDLTLTNRLGRLSGTLRQPDAAPASGFTIVVFPDDRALWPAAFRYVVATRPATTGEFLVDRLLPGRYRVAVVTDPRRNEWLLPAFLGAIAATSTPVTIGRGERLRIDLVTGRR